MQLSRLSKLLAQGVTQKLAKGQVFYSLDFKEEFYLIKSGYVKRYQILPGKERVIESIYGPDYFFPLSQAYRSLIALEIGQDEVTYIYEAMTDVEIHSIESSAFKQAIEKDTDIYIDLFVEAGRRLKANINRLASNALKSDYKKMAHQLVWLADEYPVITDDGIAIDVPLQAVDMAEQLNIPTEVSEEALKRLEKRGLISIKGETITIQDIALLKDVYL